MNPDELFDICTDYVFEQRKAGSRTMLYEPILFVSEKDGTFVPVKTLYRPDEILAVRSPGLDLTYRENIDYTVTDGAILPTAKTSMPFFAYDDYYLKEAREGKSFPAAHGHLAFGEGPFFHDRQISVSYRHSETWDGPDVPDKGGTFSAVYRKIRAGEPLNLLFNGDSITTGANSSGCETINVKPFMPPFPDLFAAVLRRTHNIRVNLENIAVGGTRSAWGVERNRKYLDDNSSGAVDLYVIAFGMNDGSGKVPAREYRSNIERIIADTRARYPDCEFMLVSTMLPNPLLPGFGGTHLEFLGELLRLERELAGVAAADMTGMHGYLLTRKRYQDMTGNNVNHPNDFLARVYAQVLLKTFGEPLHRS